MTKSVHVYWSFRSPYSYLVLPQLRQLMDEISDLEVIVKPVYPLAVRDVTFFTQRRPQQIPYLLRDCMREAERLNLPFRWPRPDPIVQELETMTVAKDQPLIDRLMLIGAAAQKAKGADAFALFENVSALIFGGSVDDWTAGDHLAKAVAAGGFDLEQLEADAQADAEALMAFVRSNEEEQFTHHWGVPLMVHNDEPFYGQDRLPALRWRLEQN